MKRKAISLVEIIIAAVVFLAAAIPLWGLMGSSHQQVLRSADEIKASQIVVELLEQIENSHNLGCLPNDNDEKTFNLQSGESITLGSSPSIELKVGAFDDYMAPTLYISSAVAKDAINDDKVIGRTVFLVMDYKSKEGRDLTYTLRGFVSANN